MIINIRGTNGSGKTAIVRRILGYKVDEYYLEYIKPGANGRLRPLKWLIHRCMVDDQLVFVLGRYDVPQGGCDTEKDMGLVEECVRRCIALYGASHIVFEGMAVSSSGARFIRMAEETGSDRWLWAILRPPIEVCIERIRSRNGDKPVLPSWMERKQRTVDLFENRVRNMGVGRVLNLPVEGSPTDHMNAILEAAK